MNFEITKKIGWLTISFVGHCLFPLSFYSKKSQSNVCNSRNIISCSRQDLLIKVSVRDFIVGQPGVHVMAIGVSIATYNGRVEINLAFSSTNCWLAKSWYLFKLHIFTVSVVKNECCFRGTKIESLEMFMEWDCVHRPMDTHTDTLTRSHTHTLTKSLWGKCQLISASSSSKAP